MSGWNLLSNGSAFTNLSHTVRGFTPDFLSTIVTSVDDEYHSYNYINTLGTAQPIMPFVVAENWTGIGDLDQTQLDALTQSTLDTYTQNAIEGQSLIVSDVDGSSLNNYGLNVPAIGTAGATVYSIMNTEDLTGMQGSTPYLLDLSVWGWPGSAIGDTTKSNIFFLDNSGGSVSFPFSSSAIIYPGSAGNSFTSGTVSTNFTAQIGLSSLGTVSGSASINPTHLMGVGFNLFGLGTSTYTFKCEDLKLIDSNYTRYTSGVQTKWGRLRQERFPGFAQGTAPAVYKTDFQAENFTHVVRFDSGTVPVTTNQFNMYYRVNPSRASATADYIRLNVSLGTASVTITGYDGGTAGTAQAQLFQQTGTQILNQQCLMVVALNNNTMRTQIYTTQDGSHLNTLLLDTGSQLVNSTTHGYIGYDFTPTTGDFQIDYMFVKDAILASYTSETATTLTPVMGASLFTVDSPASNIDQTNAVVLSQEPVGFGNNLLQPVSENGGPADVTVTTNSMVAIGTVPSYQVTKNVANAYEAGLSYPGTIVTNNVEFLEYSGYLRYDSLFDSTSQRDGSQGAFRVVLWDKWFQKPLLISELTGLTPNQWNYFKVPALANNIYDNEFNITFQHAGTIAAGGSANFYLNSFKVTHKNVEWQASNNGGLTWMPFYDNIDSPYMSVRFPYDRYDDLIPQSKPAIYWKLNDPQWQYAGTSFATASNGYIYPVYTYPNWFSATAMHAYDSSINGNTAEYLDLHRIQFQVGGTEIVPINPLNSGIRMTNGAVVYCGTPLGLSTSQVTTEAWIRSPNFNPSNNFIVPAYFYPAATGSPWGPGTAATAPVTPNLAQTPVYGNGYVIVNPSSGPGTAIDPNYTLGIQQARAAGWKMLGYINTEYGTAPLPNAQMLNYNNWYQIDSFFLDNVDATGSATFTDYYCEVYALSKTYFNMGNPNNVVVLNFGTNPSANYLGGNGTTAIGDVGIMFENSYTALGTTSLANYATAAIPAGMVIYSGTAAGGTAGTAAMTATIASANANNGISWFYITDEADASYNKLPSYASAEINYLIQNPYSNIIVGQYGTTNGSWALHIAGSAYGFRGYQGGTKYVTSGTHAWSDVEAKNALAGTPDWHHIVATYNGTATSLYFDGQVQTISYGYTAHLNATASIYIRGPNGGSDYRYQDETAVYPVALTEDIIKRHYAAGVSNFRSLQVKASAYSPDAWIQSYQLEPQYARPGILIPANL